MDMIYDCSCSYCSGNPNENYWSSRHLEEYGLFRDKAEWDDTYEYIESLFSKDC